MVRIRVTFNFLPLLIFCFQTNAQRILDKEQAQTQYVACEGPTASSVYDFWCLVWQEGVERIVSVNFPYEERLYQSIYDKNKETVQYWPMVEGESLVYMPIIVKCLESRMMVSYGLPAMNEHEMVYRICRLRLTFSNPIGEPEPDREIIHMCYYR